MCLEDSKHCQVFTIATAAALAINSALYKYASDKFPLLVSE